MAGLNPLPKFPETSRNRESLIPEVPEHPLGGSGNGKGSGTGTQKNRFREKTA